jgi:aspartate/methionine/tyrosine aminotransferase
VTLTHRHVRADNNADVGVLTARQYDCLTYDGKEHVRIAALPGMWERTLTVGSAGKSFAATGWRVGAYFNVGRDVRQRLV